MYNTPDGSLIFRCRRLPHNTRCMLRIGLCSCVFDDVIGRRRGRQTAELLSVDTRDTSTIRCVYNMPGAGFAFGKPTLAEISLKMSIACMCRMGLLCGLFDDVTGRRNGREKADILSAVIWGSRRIT